MATIFSSGCYVPYIYYNSYTTSLFQASPVFDLLFYLSARSLHYRPLQNLGLQLHVMLITPPVSEGTPREDPGMSKGSSEQGGGLCLRGHQGILRTA